MTDFRIQTIITTLPGKGRKENGKGRRLESPGRCPTLISVTNRCFTIVLGQLCRFYFLPEEHFGEREREREALIVHVIDRYSKKAQKPSTFTLDNFFHGISNNAQEKRMH